jgi:hypothetical protein
VLLTQRTSLSNFNSRIIHLPPCMA